MPAPRLLRLALLAAVAGLAAVALSARGVAADDVFVGEHVRVTLLAEPRAVPPGERVLLGVCLEPEPGWHVYWKNPGDAGVAPRVAWTLPAFLAVTALEWPAPVRRAEGPVVTYVYAGRTVLLWEAEAAASAGGDVARVEARVSWLVCRDLCVAGEATLALDLPVRRAGASPAAPWLLEGLARVPRALAPTEVAARLEDGSVRLDVADEAVGTPAADEPIAFFPESWRTLDEHGVPERLPVPGGLSLRLALAPGREREPTSLGGLLVVGPAGAERAYRVDVRLAAAPGAGRPRPWRLALVLSFLFVLTFACAPRARSRGAARRGP
jgi:thiol:disulfide interchange protein DsbD